jgi:hypothetical protein
MTLEQLQAARDELNRALWTGQKVVQFADGRRVEYQTVDQMLTAKADLDAEITSLLQGNQPGTLGNFQSRISFGVRA